MPQLPAKVLHVSNPEFHTGSCPTKLLFTSREGLKEYVSQYSMVFFEDFIINVINEALKHKEELHENGIDSNDVLQRITRQLMRD